MGGIAAVNAASENVLPRRIEDVIPRIRSAAAPKNPRFMGLPRVGIVDALTIRSASQGRLR